MLKKITAVFPEDYQNPPTVAEIREEVKRQIAAAHIIPLDLTEWLESVECPYMREAYALALNSECEKLEKAHNRRFGCLQDNCWKPYWDTRSEYIHDVLDQAREEQIEMENSAKEELGEQPIPAPVPLPQAPVAAAPQTAPTTIINIAAGAAYYDIHSCTNLNIR